MISRISQFLRDVKGSEKQKPVKETVSNFYTDQPMLSYSLKFFEKENEVSRMLSR